MLKLCTRVLPSNKTTEPAVLPVGCIAQPLVSLGAEAEAVDDSPLPYAEQLARCEHCGAYINHCCALGDVEWMCAICSGFSALPHRYAGSKAIDQLSELQLPAYEVPFAAAELSAPQLDPACEPLPELPVVIALVDVSGSAETLGVWRDALLAGLRALHDDTLFCLLTVSEALGVFLLGSGAPHLRLLPLPDEGESPFGLRQAAPLARLLCRLSPPGRRAAQAAIHGLKASAQPLATSAHAHHAFSAMGAPNGGGEQHGLGSDNGGGGCDGGGCGGGGSDADRVDGVGLHRRCNFSAALRLALEMLGECSGYATATVISMLSGAPSELCYATAPPRKAPGAANSAANSAASSTGATRESGSSARRRKDSHAWDRHSEHRRACDQRYADLAEEAAALGCVLHLFLINGTAVDPLALDGSTNGHADVKCSSSGSLCGITYGSTGVCDGGCRRGRESYPAHTNADGSCFSSVSASGDGCGLTTLRPLVTLTGGALYYYAHAAGAPAALDMAKLLCARSGTRCLLRLRTSPSLRVRTVYGPLAADREVDNLYHLTGCTEHMALGFDLEVVSESAFSPRADAEPTLQLAFLYTQVEAASKAADESDRGCVDSERSSEESACTPYASRQSSSGSSFASKRAVGVRRLLRVHTVQLGAAEGAAEFYASVDAEVAAALLVRKMAAAAEAEGLREAKRLLQAWHQNLLERLMADLNIGAGALMAAVRGEVHGAARALAPLHSIVYKLLQSRVCARGLFECATTNDTEHSLSILWQLSQMRPGLLRRSLRQALQPYTDAHTPSGDLIPLSQHAMRASRCSLFLLDSLSTIYIFLAVPLAPRAGNGDTSRAAGDSSRAAATAASAAPVSMMSDYSLVDTAIWRHAEALCDARPFTPQLVVGRAGTRHGAGFEAELCSDDPSAPASSGCETVSPDSSARQKISFEGYIVSLLEEIKKDQAVAVNEPVRTDGCVSSSELPPV